MNNFTVLTLRNLNPGSMDKFRNSLASDIERAGFRFFAYFGVQLPGWDRLEKPFPFFLSNYPEEWLDRYQEKHYQYSDPVVETGTRSRMPFVWKGIARWPDLGPKQKRLMHEATEFGIRNGLTVPTHGPGNEAALFTVVTDRKSSEFDDVIRENCYMLTVLTHHIHWLINESLLGTTNPKDLELSPRERECLHWCARGKTTWETSRIIHRSEATVNFHMQNAMRKLNVHNKCHAVAKVTARGLIP